MRLLKLGKIPKDASIEVVGISDYELIVSKPNNGISINYDFFWIPFDFG